MNEHPESIYSPEERILEDYLSNTLTPFPIHRIRVRKNYSTNQDEISLDIELDSTLVSEKLYNKIVYRIFKAMEIDMITLQNHGNYSNFPYFFYGEKSIAIFKCSIFIDVPSKAYASGKSQLR